ncbi:nuclear transport factor 2 family protein [Dactylosporangium sp. NPDC049140]|uniref:nuclear transport factor 2 family protein n=1 Tax=Dactylosporangium sp. NPDC049140 TaxID=3155647 RepID=UPI0033C90671
MRLTTRQVVDRVLEVGVRQDVEGFIGLLAADATLEWPFRPEGAPPRLHGRAEIRAFMTRAARPPITFEQYRNVVVHETTNPEVTIVEYEVLGRVTTTGAPFHQTIIAVIRVHNGEIASYRDYLNPLALAAARS